MIKKCLNCNKGKAVKHKLYGYINCKDCQRKQRELDKPKQSIELTTEEIKESRKIYFDDVLQSRREGVLSKEYIKKYPESAKQMVREGNATVQELNSAKNVWSDMKWYKD